MAQLPGVFIEAVEKLEVNSISNPIRSDAGYHLIKLYERRGGGASNLSSSISPGIY